MEEDEDEDEEPGEDDEEGYEQRGGDSWVKHTLSFFFFLEKNPSGLRDLSLFFM